MAALIRNGESRIAKCCYPLLRTTYSVYRIQRRNCTNSATSSKEEVNDDKDKTEGEKKEKKTPWMVGSVFPTEISLSPVVQAIKDSETKQFVTRKHPGNMSIKTVQIPEVLERAVNIVLEGKKETAILAKAKKLKNFLSHRIIPLDDKDFTLRAKKIEDQVLTKKPEMTTRLQELESKENLTKAETEEFSQLTSQLKSIVMVNLRASVYHTLSPEYNSDVCLQYMVARIAENYSVMIKCLSEIKKRDPEYHPSSVFDMGSGLGTTVWAVHALWKEGYKELYCVDSAIEMVKLSSLLLRECLAKKKVTLECFKVDLQWATDNIWREEKMRSERARNSGKVKRKRPVQQSRKKRQRDDPQPKLGGLGSDTQPSRGGGWESDTQPSREDKRGSGTQPKQGSDTQPSREDGQGSGTQPRQGSDTQPSREDGQGRGTQPSRERQGSDAQPSRERQGSDTQPSRKDGQGRGTQPSRERQGSDTQPSREDGQGRGTQPSRERQGSDTQPSRKDGQGSGTQPRKGSDTQPRQESDTQPSREDGQGSGTKPRQESNTQPSREGQGSDTQPRQGSDTQPRQGRDTQPSREGQGSDTKPSGEEGHRDELDILSDLLLLDECDQQTDDVIVPASDEDDDNECKQIGGNVFVVPSIGNYQEDDVEIVTPTDDEDQDEDVENVPSTDDEDQDEDVEIVPPTDDEDQDDDKDEDYNPSGESDEEDEEGYSSDMSEVIEAQDSGKWKQTVEMVVNEIVSAQDPEESAELTDTSLKDASDSQRGIEVAKEREKLPEKEMPDENASEDYTLDERPKERKLSDFDCIYDDEFPKVYIKRYQTGNEKSKHGRVYDRVYACLYCHQLLTNIQTHLMNKHVNKKEVKEIASLKDRKKTTTDQKAVEKELKQKLSLLRNKGNNLHNRKVLKWKEGELLVPRRSGKNRKFHIEEYGPCPNCEEWILLNTSITNHQVACPASPSPSDFHKGSAMLSVRVMTGKITLKGSRTLKKEVFPSMKRDKVADIAVNDDLIIGLGDIWLMKNVDNKRKRKYYSSFHMRLAARLLQELRKKKDQAHLSFQEALKPAYFDLFVESSLNCAYSDSSKVEEDEMIHPSTPVKLGFDISRLAGLKLAHAIKMSDEVGRQEATDFIKLLKMEWSTRVNRIARATLAERMFNTKKPLPDPDDIVKLANYLVSELQKLQLDPAVADGTKFRRVAMLVLARLLLYNRRRPGELEALSLDYYSRRSTKVTESDMSLRQQLTELEKKMLENQELVEIRGKNGTRVPVIIPKEAVPAMEYLANPVTRKNSGIREDNIFLFANSALDVIRAASSLEEMCSSCSQKLKFPERVHATNLRKHCATIAQVIGLKDHELKWLCRHLGHTQKVHEQHYKSTSGLIERLDIAKMMLLQEGNLQGKFQGKSLQDISFEEILETEETSPTREQVVEEILPVEDVIVEDLELDNGEDILKTRKKPKSSTRKTWTKSEEEELKKLLPEYFNGKNKKTCPSRHECLEAIQRSREQRGVLHLRTWEIIKKKINNMLLRANPQREMIYPNVYIRSNMPSPNTNRYSMVVCAHTLFDVRDKVERTRLIKDLWKMTTDYIILVDNGTYNGHVLIQEARAAILKQAKKDKEEAHVFAPCPHDRTCPIFELKQYKVGCKSQVKFRPLQMNGGEHQHEKFSYVIIKKGPLIDESSSWPRLIKPTNRRNKHLHCYACCPDGKLNHYVFTKQKHNNLYSVAKFSDWGDLLPVEWPYHSSRWDYHYTENIKTDDIKSDDSKTDVICETSESEVDFEFSDEKVLHERDDSDVD